MARTHTTSGFTLVELVLVMLIITIALAVAAPSMSGFARGRVVSDAAGKFVAVTHFARTQAINDGAICRVNIDTTGGKYWVTEDDGEDFVPVESMGGQTFSVPTDVRMEVGAPVGTGDQVIEFQPNGRTDTGVVRFYGLKGKAVEVVCENPLDVYHVSESGGGR